MVEVESIAILEICLYFQMRIRVIHECLVILISCFISSDSMIVDASSNSQLACGKLVEQDLTENQQANQNYLEENLIFFQTVLSSVLSRKTINQNYNLSRILIFTCISFTLKEEDSHLKCQTEN